MMNRLLLLFVFLAGFARTQTVIEYDYMETFSATYSTAGWWIPAATTGWYTNAFVSANTSAAIYGLGNGTSALEQDWYSLPNVTGLDATRQYQLKFRLASYTFSNSTAGTRGVDVADFVDVQVSTNGGVSYTSELRITGNNNSQWPYTATGIIIHTANGTFTNTAAPAGDVYTSPVGVNTTGYSTVTLNLPTNITQVAIDILCRVNGAGEEWWLDNIELIRIDGLPVELISFNVNSTELGNVVSWKTATEHNTDYFLIERSATGEFTENSVISTKAAAGNSTETISYAVVDNDYRSGINYYRLVQVDIDGKYEIFGPISIDNGVSRYIVKYINSLGQEVDSNYSGLIFILYNTGQVETIFK